MPWAYRRLTEEFSAVAKDYYDITWDKALDAAGIPVDSSLRRPESIYYDSDIRELPGSGSLPQNNLPKCLRLPQQIKPLLPLWKFQQILTKILAKGKKLKLPRARIRTKIRVKARPQTPLSLSPSKLLIQELPRHQLRTLVLVVHLFSLFTASVNVLHSYYQ